MGPTLGLTSNLTDWLTVSRNVTLSSLQFCMGGCEKKTRARESEESPLLEAAAREWLVKIWQVGKRLSAGCGDL
jgi:hypothetical protein